MGLRCSKTVIFSVHGMAYMEQSYQCNECKVPFPDKQRTTEHRHGTGHRLKIITQSR
jgi:hypothetical protein